MSVNADNYEWNENYSYFVPRGKKPPHPYPAPKLHDDIMRWSYHASWVRDFCFARTQFDIAKAKVKIGKCHAGRFAYIKQQWLNAMDWRDSHPTLSIKKDRKELDLWYEDHVSFPAKRSLGPADFPGDK